MRLIFRVRILPLPLAALLAFSGSAAVPAQTGEDDGRREVRKIFRDSLKADTAEERMEAVRSLALSGLPDGIALMQQALIDTLKNRDRLRARYRAIGRKINGLTREKNRIPLKAQRLSEQRNELAALLDRDEQVIRALRTGMEKLFRGLDRAQQKATLEPLLGELDRIRNTTARLPLLETLGYLKEPAAVAALAPFAGAREPEVRLVAVEALGRQGNPAALLALAKALEDPYWQVRVVAVDALKKVGGVAAVDALVLAMGRAEGRVIHDIVAALVGLTGQNFHENRLLWRRWWRENKADFRGPPQAAAGGETTREPPSEEEREKAAAKEAWMDRTKGTSFYGIRTRSKRIVYLLDISNSMNTVLGVRDPTRTGAVRGAPANVRKIAQALSELKSSIAALPEDATFNIVFYNHTVRVWSNSQIRATVENKRLAGEWADGIGASGNTNIFDALERAFQVTGRGTLDSETRNTADTFFLLSDGVSNRGRITDRDEMRGEVVRLNRFRKVVVHTIALGGNADVAFMRGLADDTGGEFVHIAGRR